MAVLVDSTLFLSSSYLAVPSRKPSPPPAGQPADRKPHHFFCRSLSLLAEKQHGSSLAPTTTRILGHYARLASKLALSGHLHEFLKIAEGVLASDSITAAESAGFLAWIEPKMVSGGIAVAIIDGRLVDVLDFFERVDKFGIRPLSLLDGSVIKALKADSCRLMHQGRIEEFVRLMEVLAGYGLFMKDVSNPDDTIKVFIEKRKPEMAVRYASLFPQFRFLVCSIIREFGKMKDKFCATRTYKAFSEVFDDMYVCRSLIDVYGLCGDFMISRQMFEACCHCSRHKNVHFGPRDSFEISN